MGDPGAEDARYVAIENNRLVLWLGRGQIRSNINGLADLRDTKWHSVIAQSDGVLVSLELDGREVAIATQVQGDLAPQIEMAPAPVAGVSTAHFGGQIAGLRIYREALTAEQVKIMAENPPGFQPADV